MPDVEGYSTKQIAAICRVTLREVQWWCEKGLLCPAWSDRYAARIFTANDIRRVRFIRSLRHRKNGSRIPVVDIKRLMPLAEKRAGYLLLHGPRGVYGDYCATQRDVIRMAASIPESFNLIDLGEI